MKINLLFILVLFLPLNSYSSIDTSATDVNPYVVSNTSMTDSISGEKALKSSGNLSSELAVSPLYLDRNIASIKCFASFSENFTLGLKQSLISFKTQKNEKSGRSEDENILSCDIGKIFSRYPFEIQPFAEAAKNNETAGLSIGTRAKSSVSKNIEVGAKVAYEDMLASDVVSSPAIRIGLYGQWKTSSDLAPEATLAMEYVSSKNSNSKMLRSVNDNIFFPDNSNISVVNLALACTPANNMFVSIDYYYYLQNNVSTQSYSNSTNETGVFLGHEIDMKTVIAYSENIKSSFYASVFDPGSAYSTTDDNKTFEIKGEIIVNF